MTNEEREIALYCLKASSDYHSEMCEECVKYFNCDHTMQDDVTETIIKALEQEPCEDCISRQAVMNCFKKWQPYMATRLLDFEKELSELPSVTPQPKIGRWIADVDRWGDIVTTTDGYRCSECNTFNTDKDNYCPNCGARMEVEE